MSASCSILVISYNTKEMTISCLESIGKQALVSNYEIIVVDNNSSDGSAQAISNQFPNVRLFALNENLGFAKANNYAAQFSKGDYLLLLNPDTVVLNSAIDKLLEFSKNYEDAGIWGGRTLFSDGQLNPTSCWKKMTVWGLICNALGITKVFPNSALFNPEAYGGWKRDSIKSVDIVTGCFFLIKRSLWNKLNGFDERFFMYGEEADLCLRAKKIGYSPMITPNAEIIHFGGASEKIRSDKLIKLLKAKVQLIKNHWNPLIQYLGVGLIALWPLGRYFTFWLLSIFFKNSSFSEKFNVWKDVWASRIIWMRGYS